MSRQDTCLLPSTHLSKLSQNQTLKGAQPQARPSALFDRTRSPPFNSTLAPPLKSTTRDGPFSSKSSLLVGSLRKNLCELTSFSTQHVHPNVVAQRGKFSSRDGLKNEYLPFS